MSKVIVSGREAVRVAPDQVRVASVAGGPRGVPGSDADATAAIEAHAALTENVHGAGVVVTSENIDLYAPAPDLTPYALDDDLTALAAIVEVAANKGVPGGYASLDGGGRVPAVQLPALAISSVSVAASLAEQLAVGAEEGDVVVRTDLRKTFIHNGGATGTLADFTEMVTPGEVVSVNGQVGAVNLTAADVGAATPGDLAAAVAAHEADTLGVHGIADTAALVLRDGSRSFTGAQTFDSDLILGQGSRVLGPFGNNTVANRPLFQSNFNSYTSVGVIPPAGGNSATVTLFDNATPASGRYADYGIGNIAAHVALDSRKGGQANALPIAFAIDGVRKLTIDPAGDALFAGNLDVDAGNVGGTDRRLRFIVPTGDRQGSGKIDWRTTAGATPTLGIKGSNNGSMQLWNQTRSIVLQGLSYFGEPSLLDSGQTFNTIIQNGGAGAINAVVLGLRGLASGQTADLLRAYKFSGDSIPVAKITADGHFHGGEWEVVLRDQQGQAFRSTMAGAWSDNASSRFFQIGEYNGGNGQNVAFTGGSGVPMARAGYAAAAFAFAPNFGSLIAPATSGAFMGVYNGTPASKALVVRGAPSQVGDLQQWQDTAGTSLAKIDAAGIASVVENYVGGIRTRNWAGAFRVGAGGYFEGGLTAYGNDTGAVEIGRVAGAPLNTSGIGFGNGTDVFLARTAAGQLLLSAIAAQPTQGIAKATAAQGGTDLYQWQTSEGTVRSKIASDGSFNSSKNITTDGNGAVVQSLNGVIRASSSSAALRAAIGSLDGAVTGIHFGSPVFTSLSAPQATPGLLRLDQPGGALQFRSPDNLITKTLSIDNTGAPVWA